MSIDERPVRILRRPEVQHRSGLKRSTLYLRIARGEFPAPVKLGPRAVGWVADEVDAWLRQRIAQRRGGAP